MFLGSGWASNFFNRPCFSRLWLNGPLCFEWLMFSAGVWTPSDVWSWSVIATAVPSGLAVLSVAAGLHPPPNWPSHSLAPGSLTVGLSVLPVSSRYVELTASLPPKTPCRTLKKSPVCLYSVIIRLHADITAMQPNNNFLVLYLERFEFIVSLSPSAHNTKLCKFCFNLVINGLISVASTELALNGIIC